MNEEEFLPLLLEQIKKQNFSQIEIIVADAGSQDKTVEIAQKFGCKIVKGGLPAKGRNQGAKIAKGDLLLFMDADNFYLPKDFFKNILKNFKERKLKIASFSIIPKGNLIDLIIYKAYNFFVNLTQLPFATNSILIEKNIFEKTNGFDEEIKIGEEHYFVKESAKFGKFGFIKIEPVLTSARRFEKDGRLKTYLKYALTGFYWLFLGPLKKDIFKYDFGHHLPFSRKKIKNLQKNKK